MKRSLTQPSFDSGWPIAPVRRALVRFRDRRVPPSHLHPERFMGRPSSGRHGFGRGVGRAVLGGLVGFDLMDGRRGGQPTPVPAWVRACDVRVLGYAFLGKRSVCWFACASSIMLTQDRTEHVRPKYV
jgi:hypothetical protein